MQASQTSVFFGRDDTFFGVCAALGEDFGFNPLYLRLGFAALLFYSPVAAISAYLGLGLVVLASRLIAPNPRIATASEPVEVGAPEAAEPVAVNSKELALAA